MGYEIFIIVPIAILIIGPLIYIINSKARKAEQSQCNEYIRQNNITTTAEHTYTTALNSRKIRFIVDEINRNLYISTRGGQLDKISFSDVLGAEICADNQVVDAIGCALVGGIIAGTTTNAVCSYKVLIYTKQISSPQKVINILDTKTQKDEIDYINAVNFAENVISTIKAIVHQQAAQ